MNTFQIILQRRTKKPWRVVAMDIRERENLTKRSEGNLDLELTRLLEYSLPREYGQALGKVLFRDEIRDAYTGALTHAREEKTCLHVLLTVEDPVLSSLHWERLCEPVRGNWDFISLNQDTPFSLDLPSQTDRNFPPIGKRDLSALALIAGPQDLNDPYGLPPMKPAEAVKQVCSAFGGIPCDILATPGAVINSPAPGDPGSVAYRIKGPPNFNNLCELLTAGNYTILHILCHGRLRDGETQLFLPGDNNRPITGSMLIERLSRVQGQRGLPQFVFLMACSGGSPEAENGLGGLAQRMVRELGIPAVLAMTSPVSIGTADALAQQFYQRLYAHGEPDRALVEALAGLQGNPDVTVPAIFSRLRGRPLFNESIDRKLTTADLQHGADLLAELIASRAPVLKGEADALADRLRKPLPEGSSAEVRKDQDAVLEKANQISLEVLDLSFNALALDQPVPEYNARCPFPGLAPFRVEDSEFFFGREDMLNVLIRRLEEYPFLAILGNSGSGKSSLVRAGLLPRLNTVGEAICIDPGSQPVAQLGTALTANPHCTALIIDQFEEIFTLCRDETQRQAFIEAVLAQKANRQVILAMRADFLGECAPYTHLKEEVEHHQELLAPLDIPGLRRVMEQQAGRVGLRFEGGLAEVILNDVTNEPGAMCLLQHALLLLWERRHGRLLCAKEYNAIGGVGHAIAKSADRVFETFNEADKERVMDIFRRLTRVDIESTADQQRRDTRRRVELRELVPAGGDSEVITGLVARLADGRLVVTSANPVTGQDEVEVAHEALIRYWPRLRNWLEERRDGLRLRESIRAAAQDWEKATNDPNTNPASLVDLLIHHGPRLEDALALPQKQHLTLNAKEKRYLDACLAQQIKKQQEEKRNSRRLIVFMAMITVLMILLTILSGINASRADANARKAETNQRLAEQAGTAQAQTLKTAEAARNDAVAQKAVAEESRQIAMDAKAAAEAARQEAEESQTQLKGSKDYAQQQALAARSGQLAALSMAHQGDNIDLALLLAVEGWSKNPNFDAQNALLSGMMSSLYVDQIQANLTGTYRVLVYNPDGTRLAAGGNDGKVYLLDTSSHKLVAMLDSGATQPVVSLSFSPDGSLLASSDETGITLWDGTSGQRKDQLPAKDTPHIAFYDNNTLYTSADASQLHQWDLAAKRYAIYYTMAPIRKVTCMAFSPKGQLAIGTDRGAYLWLLARWNQDRKWVFLPTNSSISSLSFSSGGLTLAIGEETQKSITLWDTGGNKKTRIVTNTSNVQMAFKPDGQTAMLAYVAADNSILLVDPLTGRNLQPPMKGHMGPVNALAFGSNGQLASDGEDRFIFWNSRTDQENTRSLESPALIRTFAVSSDGANLAVVDVDNVIHFYTLGEMKEKDKFASLSPVHTLALNKDGLLAIGANDRLLLFNSRHESAGEIPTGWQAVQMQFSQDGKTLAAANPKNGLIQTWDVTTRAMQRIIQTRVFDSFALTADGRFLVTAWEKGHVQVFEPQSGRVEFDRFQLALSESGEGLTGEGIWAEISPDGKFLFIHDYLSSLLRVFYIPTQQQVYELPGWAFKPGDQVVSPDGFMSVSRNGNRVLRILSLDPASLRNYDCQKAGRNLTQSEWATFFPDEDYRKTCPQWETGR